MSPRLALPFLLLCSIWVGCDGGSGAACEAHAECTSGFCKADGTCGPAPADGGADADGAADAPSSACAPDHDGVITLAELPLVAGRSATFRIATNAAWSTAGQANPDGSRRWDLSASLAGDADHAIALASPVGTWWQDKFPGATYAAPLVSTSSLIGVFAVDATGVTLLGVVSPDAGAYRTELAYDPPARILAVPVTAGATWMTTSTVSGVAQGVIAVYTERYASHIDQVGTMMTPYGEFPVLRVATDLTRTSGLATLLTKRSFAWVAECFGTVATVQSQDFETSAELTSGAEVRRLAP
jgi:hypothetical protein